MIGHARRDGEDEPKAGKKNVDKQIGTTACNHECACGREEDRDEDDDYRGGGTHCVGVVLGTCLGVSLLWLMMTAL